MRLNCPVCNSDKIEKQSPYRIKQKGGEYLSHDYQLLICQTCGIWFKDTIPSADRLRLYYEELIAEASPWNYTERLPHEQELDKILASLPNGSKVLDVGCWTGRLLSPHYPKIQLFGIEPNISAAEIASENGLKVLGNEVNDKLSTDYSFECITMVDVFEHLENPVKVINNLISALKPGGKLLIVTGRTDCFPVLMASASYWYFLCPEHIVFLNKRFSKWLQNSISTVKIEYKPLRHFRFQLTRSFYELAWLICWRFLSPHSPMKKPSFYKLPGFKRFERLQEPVLCSMWKDHVLIEIKKGVN